MGTDRVVMPSPRFDQHFCLGKAVKDLTIEQFVAERPIEAFRCSHSPMAMPE